MEEEPKSKDGNGSPLIKKLVYLCSSRESVIVLQKLGSKPQNVQSTRKRNNPKETLSITDQSSLTCSKVPKVKH